MVYLKLLTLLGIHKIIIMVIVKQFDTWPKLLCSQNKVEKFEAAYDNTKNAVKVLAEVREPNWVIYSTNQNRLLTRCVQGHENMDS